MKCYTKLNKTGKNINYIEYNNIEWKQHRGYYVNKQWGTLHRYIWSQYNGNIPHKHDVYFRDKNRNNYDITNIDCKPHAEHTKIAQTGVNDNPFTQQHRDNISKGVIKNRNKKLLEEKIMGKTNKINEIGIPFVDAFYKNYFNMNNIKRADWKQKQGSEILDQEHAVDAELTTNFDNTITIQEKIRTFENTSWGDFTLGLYKNIKQDLNDPKNRGEFFHLHAQWYVTAFLNESQTGLHSIYLLNIAPLIKYIQDNHLDIKYDVYVSKFGNYLITKQEIIDSYYSDLKNGTLDSTETLDEYVNMFIKFNCLKHYNKITDGKNTRCNSQYSKTYFMTGLFFQDLIKNGICVYHKIY